MRGRSSVHSHTLLKPPQVRYTRKKTFQLRSFEASFCSFRIKSNLTMVFEHPSLVIAVIAIVYASIYNIYWRGTGPPEAPPNLPWVGVREGWFGKWRARISAFGNSIALLEDGYRRVSFPPLPTPKSLTKYQQYSTSSLPFILPFLTHTLVLVPSSEVKWIIDQPEHVLNVKEMQKDSLQTDYSLLDPEMADRPIHESTIRRQLTRSLGTLIPQIMEELQVGVDKFWGFETEEWKEVVPFEDCLSIVSRATNRIFVGLPLCKSLTSPISLLPIWRKGF